MLFIIGTILQTVCAATIYRAIRIPQNVHNNKSRTITRTDTFLCWRLNLCDCVLIFSPREECDDSTTQIVSYSNCCTFCVACHLLMTNDVEVNVVWLCDRMHQKYALYSSSTRLEPRTLEPTEHTNAESRPPHVGHKVDRSNVVQSLGGYGDVRATAGRLR